MLSHASPLPPAPLPPPPPAQKRERRLSIKSIAASLRRSSSYSATAPRADEPGTVAAWSTDEPRSPKSRRPSSLFSWRSNRSSIVVVAADDGPHEDTKGEDRRRDDKNPTPPRRHRRTRASSPPPPVPPLVIEVDNLASYSMAAYKPLPPAKEPRARPSLAPSLPDFRQSTFQPLSLDSTSTTPPPPLPKLPAKVGHHLAARGPFPNVRPLSTLSANSSIDPLEPLPRSKGVSDRRSDSNGRAPARTSSVGSPPAAPAAPRAPTALPRLEPRSPRTHRRTRSTPTVASVPSLPSLPPPPPLPVVPSNPSGLASSSSSMHRSPSWTQSLPTVVEVPLAPVPANRKLLKPIVIAPRAQQPPPPPARASSSSASSSSSGSTPESSPSRCYSAMTTMMSSSGPGSPSSSSSSIPLAAAAVEDATATAKNKEGRFDFDDLERRLRTLSDDRLHILLAELKRNQS
ncbi:hypothetical protein JCM11491_002091 [Sporobolomyces phaffii]